MKTLEELKEELRQLQMGGLMANMKKIEQVMKEIAKAEKES
jgi:ribosomal protein L29